MEPKNNIYFCHQYAPEKGIGTIVDIVLNHKAGGDEKERFQVYKVDPNNRQKFHF